MSACGSGYGSLDRAFAAQVELALVHAELRERLDTAPSLEVFREEHRADVLAAGRPLTPRRTMERLVRAQAG
ncbi:MAG: hypothetical protein OEW31_05520 [Thermoleophilia bacterium]|nr:hypothetical protein [Thermoleophilia bacterium]MDH4345772.1 hypothetical protein [Thermoleophilia bacterium]